MTILTDPNKKINNVGNIPILESMVQSKISILNINFDRISYKKTIQLIDFLVQKQQPSMITTPNVDHLLIARKDGNFKKILNNSALVLADGQPIVFASYLLGNPLPERVTGADIFPEVFSLAEKKGYKIFLLGDKPKVSEKIRKIILHLFPRLQIGSYSPPFDFDKKENQKIINKINKFKPDVLFVAFGTPKQEKWIYNHLDELKIPLSIGVGAAFKFLAGDVKRAPKWVGNLGFEWLYRAFQEPRLLKRYLYNLIFFPPLILKQMVIKR